MVLMSADNDPEAGRDGDYSFKMPQAIPSYLLAIAAGDLVFAPISGRSGVWAEPAMVEKAAAEFADTEKMIEVTEQLYGPYRWERYDMLVLPPSFPYGGMENPRLSFITPTVRSEEHTSELQSLMRISYAVFCLKKKKKSITKNENSEPIC